VFDALCSEARSRAERQTFSTLIRCLTEEQRAGLDELLAIRPEDSRTWLAWLRQPPNAATSGNLLRQSTGCGMCGAFRIEIERARTVHRNRFIQIARKGVNRR
jgi:hypothetical protein